MFVVSPSGFILRDPESIPCAVYVPQHHDPVGTLLFLHGLGECGTNGTLPLVTGLPTWLMRTPERWPFVVVIPQKPEPGLPWHDYEGAVMAHLDGVLKEQGLDPERVAITGLSQGGNGALRIASLRPERFRGVASVCGFARFFPTEPESDDAAIVDALTDGLAAMSVRLFHGEDDVVIPVDESRRVKTALEARGHTASLETYAGVGHDAWDRAYGAPDLAAWFVELLGP